MNDAAAADAPVPLPAAQPVVNLDALLEALREGGWRIGIDEERRCAELLVRLTVESGRPADAPTAARFLKPLLCATPDELARFESIALRRTGPTPEPASGLHQEPQDLEDELRSARAFGRRAVLIVAGIALVVVVVVAVAHLRDPNGSDPSAPSMPSITPTPTEVDLGEGAEAAGIPFAVYVGAATLAGVAILLLFRYRARHVVRRRPSRGMVDVMTADLGGRPAYAEEDEIRLARAMRIPVPADERDIDLRRSVDQTVRLGGHLSLVYTPRRRRPEFVVLLERRSAQDAMAERYRHIFGNLAARDVAVDLYEFRSNPTVLRRVSTGESISLGAVAAASSSRRLILVARGSTLMMRSAIRPHRWVSRLHEWPDRILIDTEADDGYRRDDFMTLTSLSAIAAPPTAPSQFARRDPKPRAPLPMALRRDEALWTGSVPIDGTVVAEMVMELRHRLGPIGFQWFAACAVYPEISYWLTIHLGDALVTPEGVSAAQVFEIDRLLELPWMRAGYMPDWFRRAVLTLTAPHELVRVRRATQAVLLAANQPGRVDSGALLRIARDHPDSVAGVWRSAPRSQLPLPDDPILIDVVRGRTPALSAETPKAFALSVLEQSAHAARADALVTKRPSRRTRRYLVAMDGIQVGLLGLALWLAAVRSGSPLVWVLLTTFAGLGAGVAWPAGATRSCLISVGTFAADLGFFIAWAAFADLASPEVPASGVVGVLAWVLPAAAIGTAAAATTLGNARSAVAWREYMLRARRAVVPITATTIVLLAVSATTGAGYEEREWSWVDDLQLIVVFAGLGVCCALIAPLYTTHLRVLPFIVLVGLVWAGSIYLAIRFETSSGVNIGALAIGSMMVVLTGLWTRWATLRGAGQLPLRSWRRRRGL